MKRELLLILAILLSIFYSVFSNPPPLTGAEAITKADELMALQETAEGVPNARLVAWSYGGDIFILDNKLKVIDKISIRDTPVRQIIQMSGNLFVLADRNKKDGTIESVISQYDLDREHRIRTWCDPNHYIWSLSANVRMPVAISSSGDLLELDDNNLKPVAKYPERSYYIQTKEREPIICTSPDLTKLRWKPSFCYREGKYNWENQGRWRSITPPFLCNNYLVEENLTTDEKTKADEKIISIINIATGTEVNRRTVGNLSALGCAENGLIYASGSTLITCDVPDFNHMQKIATNCKHIASAAKIGDTVYFTGDKRGLFRLQLK